MKKAISVLAVAGIALLGYLFFEIKKRKPPKPIPT